jgi:hypothetical protein
VSLLAPLPNVDAPESHPVLLTNAYPYVLPGLYFQLAATTKPRRTTGEALAVELPSLDFLRWYMYQNQTDCKTSRLITIKLLLTLASLFSEFVILLATAGRLYSA